VNFANAADTSWFSWIQTTIHECTHVLAFSNALFKYYINPGTNKQLGEAAVSTTAYDRSWVVLPNVVKQAQTYYNCPNAWGAPLENNGGQGTAGSHWERTTFGNEAMTGSDFPGAVFSVFTFKLLEGSGWYLPNYNYAQPFIWGMGEGCPLEQGACPTTGTAEFCNST
jgi:leishmanolysin